MSYTSRTVVAVFVVGLLVGGGAVAFVLPGSVTTSPTSSTGAATGCVADPPAGPSSYLVRVPDGDLTTFLFNRTFAHESTSLQIRGTVETPEPGTYVYRVTTTPDADSEKPAPEDCTPFTRMDGVASVPSDYERFSVVVDGETLATVENDGSHVIFRRVENGTA
ncbi:hypothetical protein NDI76_09935 [Halogeometricum sp. S1BR25-6]|uniref:Secreted protein n=1 Tax=Halogeometricum salsisoli TaxID=2950536 RepID=A0ABU2GE30_9EURY|nr:hypothetical protein [Halogeometricum sp. S1BR25-6]MDS0299062.1 hypothetical protein [Halogeometricum sp. S1BR25-6]